MSDNYCTECSGVISRSVHAPDQPADSDLCAACWYNAHYPSALLGLDELDELIHETPEDVMPLLLRGLHGALVDWHGDIGKFVNVKDVGLRIEVTMACAKCGGNPAMFHAGYGPHAGAYAYIFDPENGAYLGDLRDEEFLCEACSGKAQP